MRTVKSQKTAPRLYLTTRGQLVFTGLALVLAGIFVMLCWIQSSTPPAMASHDHASDNYHQIVVQPGDTLWGISSRVSQGADQARVLDEIVAYNDLETSDLEVGRTLYVPVRN